MPNDTFNKDEINRLINSAWESALRHKFEERLQQLGITKNQAVENLEVTSRTLDGILDGTLKQVDFISLLKVGHFLEVSYEEVTKLYTQSVTAKHGDDLEQSKRRSFILNNFDLPTLKSIGVIDSIRDFEHIEKRLNQLLGLNIITDFEIGSPEAAFCSTSRIPKSLNSRKYFIAKANAVFKAVKNYHDYNRDSLVNYFQNIRWHSMDVDNGLFKVISTLYSLGVTVIFLPKMPKLAMRGATFAVNNKPCIVLTDYRGSYPTLWFALIHELFHVLFDWEEILMNKYHLSDEESDLFIVQQKEAQANGFAREFMISKTQRQIVADRISDMLYVKEFAIQNHIHPSIVYAHYAYEHSDDVNNYWIQFKDYLPSIKILLNKLGSGMEHTSSAQEIANFYKTQIFNER